MPIESIESVTGGPVRIDTPLARQLLLTTWLDARERGTAPHAVLHAARIGPSFPNRSRQQLAADLRTLAALDDDHAELVANPEINVGRAVGRHASHTGSARGNRAAYTQLLNELIADEPWTGGDY